MTFDAHSNFAYTVVSVAPSPVLSGTSLTVATGMGSRFPQPPFNATVWPAASALVPLPLASNAEVVRVTALSGDVLTISRAQEGSTARTILAGDQIAAGITAKTLTDVEAAAANSLQSGNNLSDVASASTARTNLGLGSAATQASSAFDASGAASTAQAASLQKASNLSDVASAATARTNLGLGTAATQASSAFDTSGAAATAQAASLQKASNLTDVSDSEAAKWSLNVASTSAKAVATANVALSGLQTIDGYVTSATGTNGGPDTVLLTAQTTGSQNGLWLVASGAWSRPSRFPAAGVINRSLEATIGGGSFAGTAWVLPVTSAVTVDTTAQAWVQRPLTAAQMPSSVVSVGSGDIGGTGSIPQVISVLNGKIPFASSNYIDLCTAWNNGSGPISAVAPAKTLTVSFTASSATATVTAGTAPASGAIIADVLPNGTTFTASGNTLTLSNPASSTVSAPAYAGQDITSQLQAAFNYFVTKAADGTVVFSQAGPYIVNGPQQTGTAFGYSYSGQIVFPARAQSGTSSLITIRIKGTQPFAGMPGGGIANATGGVVLVGSPVGTGSMFDSIPGYTLSSKGWTAVVGQFEDVTLRVPDNPQGNVVNGTALAGLAFRGGCLIDTITVTNPSSQTGAGYAVMWPPNGNMALLRQTGELAINGYPNATNIGEHLTSDYLFIQYCSNGIVAGVACTHPVRLNKVCLQSTTNGITVSNTDAHIVGFFDIGDAPPAAFINDPNNYLYGDIQVAPVSYGGTDPGLGFPSNGGQNASIRPFLRPPSAWPSDTFKRINASLPATYTYGPGGTDRTGHIWAPTSAIIVASGGGITAAASTNPLTWLKYNTGRNNPSRIVRAKLTTGTTGYNFWLVLSKVVSGANNKVYVQLNNGNLNIQKVIGTGGTTIASAAGVVAASTAYTLDVVVSNPYSAAGAFTVTAYLNGTQVATWTLASGDAAGNSITQLADADEFSTQDGFGMFGDTTTKLTEFSVLPA